MCIMHSFHNTILIVYSKIMWLHQLEKEVFDGVDILFALHGELL